MLSSHEAASPTRKLSRLLLCFSNQSDFDLSTELNQDMVDCECEASRSSRNPMLQCDICSNYKHSECYGYLGTRLYPMDFACYTCLQSFDKDLLKNMQSVCVKRRVLNFLQQGGNATELGELINKDDSSVLRILGE